MPLAACGGPGWRKLDRVARTTEARTVVYERDFSLYSPFDLLETRPWVTLVEQQLAEVAALLEVDPTEQREREGPLIVRLRELAGLKPQVSVVEQDRIQLTAAPAQHPLHGIEGYASERMATVFVEAARTLVLPDGHELRGLWSASEFRSTLRHELAHALAHSAGIAGEAWLGEGAALLVEFGAAGAGGGAPRIDPDTLRLGRRLARAEPGLARLLVVHEELQDIASGRTAADADWRPRLLAFSAFLLERELARGGSLRSTIDRAQDAGRRELERLEPEWLAWLEPCALDDEPAAPALAPALPHEN